MQTRRKARKRHQKEKKNIFVNRYTMNCDTVDTSKLVFWLVDFDCVTKNLEFIFEYREAQKWSISSKKMFIIVIIIHTCFIISNDFSILTLFLHTHT